jgi:hypothetical protein
MEEAIYIYILYNSSADIWDFNFMFKSSKILTIVSGPLVLDTRDAAFFPRE